MERYHDLLPASKCFVHNRLGAIVRKSASLTSPKLVELPHRCVVIVEGVNGTRVRISHPIAGWVSFKVISYYPQSAPDPVIDEDWWSDHDDDEDDNDCEQQLILQTNFDGYRRRYYFGTRDNATGYHKDHHHFTAPVAARTLPSTHVVQGLLGVAVRSGPELWSPKLRVVPTGTRVRVVEVCEAQALHDISKLRGRLKSGGWVTMALLSSSDDNNTIRAPQRQTVSSRAACAAKLVASGQFRQSNVPHYATLTSTCRRSRSGSDEVQEDEEDMIRLGETTGARFPEARDPSKVPPMSSTISTVFENDTVGLEWLLKKINLGQHACLVGNDRGAMLNLAMQFCHITNREVEYVGLSRDTTEAELISRRELQNSGDVKWVDGPAVRACVEGRILILDGLDRAERNVLPPLNELLENRSLPIHDGHSLLTQKSSPRRILPSFVVVATCGDSRKIDPTLRSRFCAYHVDGRRTVDTYLRLGCPRVVAEKLIRFEDCVDCPSLHSVARVVAGGENLRLAVKRACGDTVNEKLLNHAFEDEEDDNCTGANDPDDVLTPTQREVANRLKTDLDSELDVCVVGGRGVGKSRIIATIAAKKSIKNVLCHSDVGVKELLSPAVLSQAKSGGIVLLDGVDRLAPGVLDAALGPLMRNRMLPSTEKVHDTFRVVATATTATSLKEDADLFMIHTLPVKLSEADEMQVLRHASSELSRGLVAFNTSIRDDERLRSCVLSPSRLVRAAKDAIVDGFEAAIYRAVAPIVRFSLEPRDREKLERFAITARRIAKIDKFSEFDSLTSTRAGQQTPEIRTERNSITVGDTTIARSSLLGTLEEKKRVFFAPTHSHCWALRDALVEWKTGAHLLFLGNQGVGKNKLADKLVELLGCEREYVQLHSDSTVKALCGPASFLSTSEPPLRRAARLGRVAIVDEIDKAPIEIAWLLKAVAEGDDEIVGRGECGRHPNFRMILLANGPRLLESSTVDVFGVCGDAVSAIVVENADLRSELLLVEAHAPKLERDIAVSLSTCLARLRNGANHQQAHLKPHQRLSYPYSSRELVKVSRHAERYPSDGTARALRDIFSFDAHSPALRVELEAVLAQSGFHDIFDDDKNENFHILRKPNAVAIAPACEESSSLATIAIQVRDREKMVIPSNLPQRYVRALRWMTQKLVLRQDMFLLCDPGPTGRRLARMACALWQREYETCSLTSEATEADLAQRRELRDGRLAWTNASPVKAALDGKILILEGLERAEPTLLPIINNLLENRQMSLDDGSTLVSKSTTENFLVIAVGPPTPKHQGRVLDPPLRSRFCGYVVPPADIDELVEDARSASAKATSKIQDDRNVFVARAVFNLRHAWEPTRISDESLPKWRRDEVMRERDSRAPPWPPERTVEAVASILALFPAMSATDAFYRFYPRQLLSRLTEEHMKQLDEEIGEMNKAHDDDHHDDGFKPFPPEKKHNDTVFEEALTEMMTENNNGESDDDDCSTEGSWSDDLDADGIPIEKNQPLRHLISEPSRNYTLASVEHESGMTRLRFETSDGEMATPTVLTPSLHTPTFTWDDGFELSSGQRSAVAAILQDCCAGLDSCLIGERGSGKSVAVRAVAACLGYDGEMRLPRTVFCHREMSAGELFALRVTNETTGDTGWRDGPVAAAARLGELCILDGIHRLAPGVLASLSSLVTDREFLDKDGVHVSAHRSFRMILTAESSSFDAEELLGLFTFHVLLPLTLSEQEHVLRRAKQHEMNAIIAYAQDLKRAARTDSALEPLILSFRYFVQIAHDMQRGACGVEDVLCRRFAGYVDFLPTPKRLAWRGLLRDCVERFSGGRKKVITPPRDLISPVIVENVSKRNTLQIGDVEAQMVSSSSKRNASKDKHFVETGTQLWALRDMLLDWKASRHLLLIGNQGVGKNRIAEHFLCLLGYEGERREYVQLHRDTSVHSLLCWPTATRGRVAYGETPLIRAMTLGHALIVDEGDKAPVDVVCILKALADEKVCLELPDGRRIPDQLKVHRDFRFVVLANRPGYPFTGNDLYRECGEVFACVPIASMDEDSHVEALRASVLAPSTLLPTVVRVAKLFRDLSNMYEKSILTYPYSTREAINLLRHLKQYPEDPLARVFDNVISFDRHDPALYATLLDVIVGATTDQGRDENTTAEASSSNGSRAKETKKYWRRAQKSLRQRTSSPSPRQPCLVGQQCTEREEEQYAKLWDLSLASQVDQLRVALDLRSARRRERVWRRFRTHGDLDELRLVDAIAGAQNVYKRRELGLETSAQRHLCKKKTRVRFVFDCSGSMYAQNRRDARLTRLLQCAMLVCEAFDGKEDEYEYSIVGHSGSKAKFELVAFEDQRPSTVPGRLKLVRRMIQHARSCASGDKTIAATKNAIREVVDSEGKKDYLVFLVSDADFAHYGTLPSQLADALTSDDRVQAYALFVGGGADAIQRKLPPGKSFLCSDTNLLVGTLRHLFLASVSA